MSRLLALLILAAACSVKPIAVEQGADRDSGSSAPVTDGSTAPGPDLAPLADVPGMDVALDRGAEVPATPDAPEAGADAAPDIRLPNDRVPPDIAPDPIPIEPDAAPPPPDLAADLAPDVAADLAVDLPPPPDLAADVAPDTAPDTARDATVIPPPSGRELVFISNQDSNDISAFSVDTVTGAHTVVPGSPFATGQRPWDLVITPDGKFLYVCHFGDEDLRGFRVAADGHLTALPGAPAHLPMPQALVMAPTGRAIYAYGTDGLLRGFTVDATTGALAAIGSSPFAGVTGVQGMAMDPLGRFLAVVVQLDPSGAGKLRLFSIGAAGALAPAAEAMISGTIRGDAPAVSFDPTGASIYGASSGAGGADQIFGFRVQNPTGTLTPLPGSPGLGCSEGHSLSFHPTRPLVYYGCTAELLVLRRAADGSLAAEPGSPILFNNDTDSALSTGANFLYVNFQTDNELTVARIGASGLPETFSGSPWKTGTNPWRIVVWAQPSF